MAESEWDIRFTTDTIVYCVYCEEFEENWPRFNGTALYLVRWHMLAPGLISRSHWFYISVVWIMYCVKCIFDYHLSQPWSASVPAPLGITTSGRCLGFDPHTYTVIIGEDCNIMFSYNGRSLRETATAREICPNDLTPGTGAFLTSKCGYALGYAYGLRGGSRVCIKSSPDLCLDVTGYIPGDTLKFCSNSGVLLTYIYKGMTFSISPIIYGVTLMIIHIRHRTWIFRLYHIRKQMDDEHFIFSYIYIYTYTTYIWENKMLVIHMLTNMGQINCIPTTSDEHIQHRNTKNMWKRA